MTPSLQRKLDTLVERHEELARQLAQPGVTDNTEQFRELSREYAHLQDLVAAWQEYQSVTARLEEARSLQEDAELGALAAADIQQHETRLAELDQSLQVLLLPRDPRDDANLFLEIRAGTGGDEAALFAGDLLRMYLRYAERQGWEATVLSAQDGEHGGYKEVVARLAGDRAFSRMKFESGTHRVQRVPETEAGGRIHTSAATVAILPETDRIETVDIDPSELRTDTFRASGAGGQHVNKTDSAVRITHQPSGIVVESQEERSQHKNRARAMSLLQARLLDQAQAQQAAVEDQSRRVQVGSGDRSQRIRTYNFPQGRVTDHRVNLTLYQLDAVMAGNLDEIVDTLTREHQAEQLTQVQADS